MILAWFGNGYYCGFLPGGRDLTGVANENYLSWLLVLYMVLYFLLLCAPMVYTR